MWPQCPVGRRFTGAAVSGHLDRFRCWLVDAPYGGAGIRVTITPVQGDLDRPRPVAAGIPFGDRLFRGVTRAGGLVVLVVTGGIGVFLAIKAAPALRVYGWGFLTHHQWFNTDPRRL